MQHIESGVPTAQPSLKTRAARPRRTTGAASKPDIEKKKRPAAKSSPTVTAQPLAPADVQELIAARAYALWESEGRPHGHDVTNWYQAEQDVMASLTSDGKASRA